MASFVLASAYTLGFWSYARARLYKISRLKHGLAAIKNPSSETYYKQISPYGAPNVYLGLQEATKDRYLLKAKESGSTMERIFDGLYGETETIDLNLKVFDTDIYLDTNFLHVVKYEYTTFYRSDWGSKYYVSYVFNDRHKKYYVTGRKFPHAFVIDVFSDMPEDLTIERIAKEIHVERFKLGVGVCIWATPILPFILL